jgi:hypothetical protein
MLIVAGTYGQLCNQLLRLAHHIAHGLEHGYAVNCADFAYRHLFANLTAHPLVSDAVHLTGWPRRLAAMGPQSVARIPLRYWAKQQGYRLLDKRLHVAPTDAAFARQAAQGIVIATDWDFRAFDALYRQHTTIKRLFTLPAPIDEQARELIGMARQQADVLVGVHIRRGDYAQFAGGRFHYDDATYARLMARVAGFFPGQSVAFLLCSNEPLDPARFAAFRVVISKAEALVDLAALSLCDWLIGPPSTFSHWASYVGQVPLWHIEQPDSVFTINDFRVSEG